MGVTAAGAREAGALSVAQFALGGGAPQRAWRPKSVEALARLLAGCDARGEAVVLFGGNTLQAMAAPPARYDVAVSLKGLSGVVDYEPRDLTTGVLAGTTLVELGRTLHAHRQFLPIDAPRAGAGTVGGALAAGWAGPRRRTYGAARDLVIGSTVVLADGTIAKAGGMVVKNVSGYDMSKLYVGSFGTLAALTRINFKTLPLPQVQRGAIARLPERTRVRALAHLSALAIEPSLAVAVSGFEKEIDGDEGLEGRLILLYEGSEATIDRAIRDLRSALGAAGVPATRCVDRNAAELVQRVVDAYVAPGKAGSVTYRHAGLPSDVDARAAAIVALAQLHEIGCETICDLSTGDVIARAAPRDGTLAHGVMPFADALRDAYPEARVLQASPELRGEIDPWGAPPAALALMRTIKQRFDPRGTLGPGRFAGGI
jgi:glycolate dehydrogenase FAD-binding subunit